ncbi:MAG TPA: hypothetical protein VIK27_09850 [Candidatus Aquilonibacter sp.]
MRHLLLAAALAASLATPAGAQDQCTREPLIVRGTPLQVELCVAAAPQSPGGIVNVALVATYTAASRSFTQRATVRFITGEGPARALNSVNLSSVGVAGTLHMTLLYSGGLVTIEHALLTPGAVTVK